MMIFDTVRPDLELMTRCVRMTFYAARARRQSLRRSQAAGGAWRERLGMSSAMQAQPGA